MRSSRALRALHRFVLVLLSVCCCGCKPTSLTINADKSYDGRTLELGIGDGVKLSLAENPTTGYQWGFLAKPEPYCVVVNDEYVTNTEAIGSSGAHNWDFRAVSKGTGSVRMAYGRPWEKDAAPAQTFKLTLVVK
ncbi:MAG TPA: protease inhibitor I42 family protein [Candidatus Sulfotelmatobacter sp.]|nr:protease inhibitor I42 family protein [Candidatus Sulfotelmatobacter sp.]